MPPSLSESCQLPPTGWTCSRAPGHEGPCAAREVSSSKEQLQRWGMDWANPAGVVHKQMDDGYWTPWHLAQAQIEQLERDKFLLRDALDALRGPSETFEHSFADKLRGRIEEMRGALYTYGEFGNAIGGPLLDGIQDAIDELSAVKATELHCPVCLEKEANMGTCSGPHDPRSWCARAAQKTSDPLEIAKGFTKEQWSSMPCANREHTLEQFHNPEQPCPLPPDPRKGSPS